MNKRLVIFYLAATVCLLAFSAALPTLLIPVVAAILLAGFARMPYMRLREKLSPPLAAITVYILLFGSVLGILVFLFPALEDGLFYLMNHMDEILGSITQYFDEPQLNNALTTIANNTEFLLEQTVEQLLSLPNKVGAIGLPLGVTVLLSYYFLTEWHVVTEGALRLLPSGHRESAVVLFRRVADVLGGFMRSRLWLMLIMSGVTAVLFLLFDIKHAIPFAIFAGIMDVIPYIGAAFGGVFPVAFLAAVSTGKSLLLILLLILYQVVENAWISPRITGGAVYLHPAWVVFLVFAGGKLFGFWGVLLSVPVGALVRTVATHFIDQIVS